jgi:hypothetical protein
MQTVKGMTRRQAVTDTDEIRRYADAVMSMISEDQDSGQVPRDVASLDELDECVDLLDYYRQAGLASGTAAVAWLLDAVSDEIDRRLSAAHAGPWHVMWKQPGGQMSDIGRAIGYPTRPEAEAVGREHVAEHGGSFHIRVRRLDQTTA